MTAVTPTRIQYFNIPTTVGYGTSNKRMVEVIVEVTSTATSDTLDLSTYVPNLAGILGVVDEQDGAQNGTANTWSTTTLTLSLRTLTPLRHRVWMLRARIVPAITPRS